MISVGYEPNVRDAILRYGAVFVARTPEPVGIPIRYEDDLLQMSYILALELND